MKKQSEQNSPSEKKLKQITMGDGIHPKTNLVANVRKTDIAKPQNENKNIAEEKQSGRQAGIYRWRLN